MKLKVVIHEEPTGGYWAEVPAIPGCMTQGETLEELLRNVHEAIQGCLSIEITPAPEDNDNTQIMEIAV
jgi:predicted RNase H-like HicB family nuclease